MIAALFTIAGLIAAAIIARETHRAIRPGSTVRAILRTKIEE